MITPTVGRLVWYYPSNRENLEVLMNSDGSMKKDPLVAVVLAVHSDTQVNILVFSAYGQSRFVSKAQLWQGEGEAPSTKERGYACWMPYQQAVSKGEIPPVLHEIQSTPANAPSSNSSSGQVGG
jgi:hypothetical protein